MMRGPVVLLLFCILIDFVMSTSLQKADEGTRYLEKNQGESRTYAHHFAKRMAVLLLPLMFKLGVMMTMMVVLTVVSVKGLLVGVVLMVVGLSHVLARAYQSGTTPATAAGPIIAYASPPPVSPIIRHVPVPYWHRRSSNARNDVLSTVPSTPSVDPYRGHATGSSDNQHSSPTYYYLGTGPSSGVVRQS